MTASSPLPEVGLQHTETMEVGPQHTVPEVERDWPGFADMPPAFATAVMVGFIEQTCIQALRPCLTVNQGSVGTHINVSHIAPTPVGLTVSAKVELVEVTGKSLLFAVRCEDDLGLIGEGTHRRAIIDRGRFDARLAEKASQI